MADTAISMAPAAASDRIEEFRNYIDGEWSAGRAGEYFDNVNPADTSDIVGRFPASCAAGCRSRRARGCRGIRGLEEDVSLRARQDSQPCRRLPRSECRSVRGRNDAGTGQGDQSEQGRNPALGPDAALLRRRGPVVHRRNLSQRRHRHGRLHPTRASWRGVGDHALEFPGFDSGAKDRACADHRQYSDLQAVVGRAAERLSPRRGLGRRWNS